MPDLAAIKRALAAATPGPWVRAEGRRPVVLATPPMSPLQPLAAMVPAGPRQDEDAILIASARTWLPELVAEVERQAAEIASLRAELARLRAVVECADVVCATAQHGRRWAEATAEYDAARARLRWDDPTT